MRKLCYFFVVVFILSVVMACNSGGGAGSGGSSLDNEARKLAIKYFKPLILHCGDSYVSLKKVFGTNLEYTRTKRADFFIEEYDTTEADKLNGIEWQGHAGYWRKGPVQFYHTYNKWGEWETWGMGEQVKLTKRNGQWHIEEQSVDHLIPFNCSDIPN